MRVQLSTLCLLLMALACTTAVAGGASCSSSASSPVIFIDLGGTNSRAAVCKDGRVHIIADEQGSRVVPSYVAFTNTERLVGHAAKLHAELHPADTVFDMKRLLGRSFDDKTVQHAIQHLPYRVLEQRDRPVVEVHVNGTDVRFTPEALYAMIVAKLKQSAEAFLGQQVHHAVFVNPLAYCPEQRVALMVAATMSGLEVVRWMQLPPVAAACYGLRGTGAPRNMLFFDLGGSTFEVAVMSRDDDGVFEVLSSHSDNLGGRDFDQRLVQHFVQLVKNKSGVNLSSNTSALFKLLREAERAKHALSSALEVQVEVEALTDDEDFSATLTRAQFEQINADLFEQTLVRLAGVMRNAGLDKNDIHDVMLVGGSTHIPCLRTLLAEFFSGVKVHHGDHAVLADEAVVYGAVVQGIGPFWDDASALRGADDVHIRVNEVSSGRDGQ